MGYTLGEAAKATGMTKPTISKAIKTGRVSAKRKENGGYDIDPAELHRVYPPVSGKQESEPVSELTPVNPGLLIENKELKAKLDASEQRIKDAVEQVADLRRRLDQSEEERRRTQHQLTALLTDQREKPAAPSSPLPLEPHTKSPSSSTSTLTTWLTVLLIMTVSIALFFWLRFSYGVTG